MNTKNILSPHELIRANVEFWRAHVADIRARREHAINTGNFLRMYALELPHRNALARAQQANRELRKSNLSL